MTIVLICGDCGREYPADATEPWRCECGHALDFAERPLPDADDPPDPASLDRDRGIWAFDAFLPVGPRATLGEGWTPLVDAPEWDAQFKLESLFPTGSFKDRGAAVTVSRAVELGVERVVEDSSGNAGLAIATYAAGAGVDAEVFVPADAKPGTLRAIERTGADVVRVEGSRQDVTDACIETIERTAGRADDCGADDGRADDCGANDGRADDGGERPVDADAPPAWYASHAWNPAFFAGTATAALEATVQRDWSVPDAVVTPLGHGTLLLGAYRGFRALRAAGWTDSMPRLLGAQATGAAPIADALADDIEEGSAANDLADGIQIREPARRDQILAAIRDTGGDAVAVGPAVTERERDRLARAGFHVEATSATATAGLETFRARGVVDPDDDVVVALTGSGLKG